MARIRTSGVITSVSGSMGEQTFGSWKGTAYVKKKAKEVRNPNTEAQMMMKDIYAKLSQNWKNMSFEEWAPWEEYAKRHAQIKTRQRKGLVWWVGGKMTGRNAYFSLNTLLMSCTLKPITKPPLDNIPQPPPPQTDLIDCAKHKEKVRFKAWLP